MKTEKRYKANLWLKLSEIEKFSYETYKRVKELKDKLEKEIER